MSVVVLRGLIVLGLLGSAWVHLDLWLVGYRDIEVIGPLFLVNVIAGVVIAVGVACWRHWLPALAAVGFGAATLGAFLLSVTVGLFGMQGVLDGSPQLLAALAETVCVLGGGLWLLAMARERDPR
ncbi:hypothetical protein [Amycolatopsis cihanbeyliensis]|uniref:Uncharacterized protein n=1 Tax=Amycolatopsis cihanbeyliensis TaxID=1128664 RepID=A0A542CT33_AMYCI|nr:hypothetical protein [Amycolatopsis cihanbeyliensis]TQI93965.1 hypothetical protein FB471_6111 [Amycolatopsis cihanbeyliensis]